MPIYEYVCRNDKCQNHKEPFEEFSKIIKKAEDDTDVVCPCCGKKDCQRIFSVSGVSVKGEYFKGPSDYSKDTTQRMRKDFKPKKVE